MAEAIRNMTREDALRFMRGVRVAAGLFRSAQTLGQPDVAGGGLCEIQGCYRPGRPQVRLLTQALKVIGKDAIMLEGFDAALTDFISGVIHCGTPDLAFYEVISHKDIHSSYSEDGGRSLDAMFQESVGLAEGAANG